MYRNLKTIFLIILYAFISGCSTVMLQPNMELVKEQSKVYQKGFKHGCNSGYVAGGSILHNFSRDSEKMANDEEYKNGWKKGYRHCKDEFRELCRSEEWISKSHLYCSDVRQQGLDKDEEE